MRNVLLTKPSVLSEYLLEQNIAHKTLKMFDYRRTVSWAFLRQLLTGDQYDLVVLSSPAAIEIYLKCNVANRVACISASSANKLSDLQPIYLKNKPYDGASLAKHLIQTMPDSATRILILAGADGQSSMFDKLASYYTNVKKVEIYERIRPEYDRASLESVFYENVFDTVVVTCNTAVQNLLYYINKYYLQFNLECNLIVPSKRVAAFAAQHNFTKIITADSIDDHDLLHTILAVK